MTSIREQLFALRDERYAAFVGRIVPGVPQESIVGVRAPQMRALAKAVAGSPDATAFMRQLPHKYLEENGLHAALLCRMRDYDEALAAVECFLPFVDNWATCDSLSPVAFGKKRDALLPHVRRWMTVEHEYSVRFGIGMLMRYYLDDGAFDEEQLRWVAEVSREEYYIRMMQAWYFATALAKQWAATVPLMERGAMGEWVRRKAIQKAVESYRVSDDHKAQLKAMR